MNRIKGVEWAAATVTSLVALTAFSGAFTDSESIKSTKLASSVEEPIQISSTVLERTTTTVAAEPAQIVPTTLKAQTAVRVTTTSTTAPRSTQSDEVDPLTPEIRAHAERYREWYRDELGFCFQATPSATSQEPDSTCNRKISTDAESQPAGDGEVHTPHPADDAQPPVVYYEQAS